MAENRTDSATATAADETFDYPIRVEDAGPATKKVHVEIPRERITAKLEEQFNELRQQAAIPGFRVGHAPKKLIEKRFSQDIKDQVRRQLISESYEQAVEKNQLQVIGEENLAKIRPGPQSKRVLQAPARERPEFDICAVKDQSLVSTVYFYSGVSGSAALQVALVYQLPVAFEKDAEALKAQEISAQSMALDQVAAKRRREYKPPPPPRPPAQG